MNDYYMTMLDIESEIKEHQDDIAESWLEYEPETTTMYHKIINGQEIEITESQYAGKLCLTIRDQQSDRLVFNLDLDYDDESCGDDSCYGTLVKLAQDWISPIVEYDEF